MDADPQQAETRQQRREERLKKRKVRMPVHGKRLVDVYKGIVEKLAETQRRAARPRR